MINIGKSHAKPHNKYESAFKIMPVPHILDFPNESAALPAAGPNIDLIKETNISIRPQFRSAYNTNVVASVTQPAVLSSD